MSRAVIPESSYPHRVREKKHRAAMAAAASFVVLFVLVWVGCLPDLTPFPRSEAGVEGGTIAPQNVCGDGIIATLDDGGDAGESCDPADATVKGCRSCQIDCSEDGGSLDSAGRCYFALGQFTNYNDAKRACQNERAHLVTLSTPEEVMRVAMVAGGQPYWVGLSFVAALQGFQSSSESEPGFSSAGTSGPCEGCFGVTDGGPISSEVDAGPECVVARKDTVWRGIRCNGSEPLVTICEREPEGLRTTSCFGGFCLNIIKTAGAKTYLLGVGSASAAEADATCKSIAGRLAVFDSVEEREQIAREIVLRYPTDQETTYWIGLANDGASWAWDDGVAADASARRLPWGDKQPAVFEAGTPARAYLRIASVYDVGLAYADDNVVIGRRYICERKPAEAGAP